MMRTTDGRPHAGSARADAGPGAPVEVVVLEMQHGFMRNLNYLLVDEWTREAVIVDPAWEMGRVEEAVARAQVVLRGVLLTHSHPDHVHLAERVSERYDCPVWMSHEEIAASGFATKRLVGIDEQPWLIGRMRIEPVLTPGHTPGCVCYVVGDSVFTGDVLFAEGCGMCPDVPAAHAMFDSLLKLRARLGPRTRVYPGHSYGKPPGQFLADLLKDNIYLQFSSRESFAAFRMRSGQTRAKLFSFR